MIVVVGGQGRKVGKTSAVCEIISATREARWVAVKVSPHEHQRKPFGDTERFLEAGAAAAYLCKPADPIPAAANLIVESNGILRTLQPDLCYFVIDPERTDVKASSRWFFNREHETVVRGKLTPAQLARIRAKLERL